MREKIFSVIEVDSGESSLSKIYDIFMVLVICISLIPLLFKDSSVILELMDIITVSIFIFDYLLRWFTADFKLNKGNSSFIKYPFTFMAVVDLLSILPSVSLLNNSLKLLRIFRLIRAFRVMRVFKVIRYSENLKLIINVFVKQRETLIMVGVLCLGYIFITALIVFNIEPGTFNTFFDAIYWATISLTTVGYGDLFATTVLGKTITMISSLFGIAIVALPAGIITAGYMKEVQEK